LYNVRKGDKFAQKLKPVY